MTPPRRGLEEIDSSGGVWFECKVQFKHTTLFAKNSTAEPGFLNFPNNAYIQHDARIQIIPHFLPADLCTSLCTSRRTSARSNSSFQRFGQNYIDANLGVAFLTGVIPFPGTSILFGRRSFGSESTFLDAELGLAFPSAVTAKLGVGRYNLATGRSMAVGIRPWPSHVRPIWS